MTAVTVEMISVADAERRRAEILESVGDEVTFRAKAEAFAVEPHDRALYEELTALEFLLSDD